MKLLSFNCNGIRAAITKGLLDFVKQESPDIIAFQEVKAESKQIDLSFWQEEGYIPFIFSATKKGYSGTAIFTRVKPISSVIGFGHELFDSEGRNILLEFKDFAFVTTYFPSGTSGDERQDIKMKFLDHYLEASKNWISQYKNVIICGDVNIAHTEKDIHNPKGNEKNSGFLPEEREWLTKFLSSGWVDTFRYCNPDVKDKYSWWTYRFQARNNNKGWRIDYFFVTESLKSSVSSAFIKTDVHLSDHAPIGILLKDR